MVRSCHNLPPETENAIDLCLKYWATQDLFSRWDDAKNLIGQMQESIWYEYD